MYGKDHFWLWILAATGSVVVAWRVCRSASALISAPNNTTNADDHIHVSRTRGLPRLRSATGFASRHSSRNGAGCPSNHAPVSATVLRRRAPGLAPSCSAPFYEKLIAASCQMDIFWHDTACHAESDCVGRLEGGGDGCDPRVWQQFLNLPQQPLGAVRRRSAPNGNAGEPARSTTTFGNRSSQKLSGGGITGTVPIPCTACHSRFKAPAAA
jgi:hypothetical protein